MDGLGFTITRQSTLMAESVGWLELGRVAVMLQEYWKVGRPRGWPTGPLGQGVSICFMCADAIAVYHDWKARGLTPSRPFVGNDLSVTFLIGPDGTAWTSRVLQTFRSNRFIPIRHDGQEMSFTLKNSYRKNRPTVR